MPTEKINIQYLRTFFAIPEGPKGDAEIEAICKKLIKQQFSHGQDICTIDAEADGMYFLESGSAVVLDRDGHQLNMLNEGQYFGEYAVLSGRRRLSTVRSYGKTVVYKLLPDDMMEILSRHPDVYGELMKHVYDQVSQKHKQLLSLSRMRRGILTHPSGQMPMTPKRMILQYGALAIVFLLSYLLIPSDSAAPLFIFPLVLMVAYVLITHRTLESLIVAGMYAALLIWRNGFLTGYTDALLETIGDSDNVFTVFVMALIGAFVSLVQGSGAVTAFQRFVSTKVRKPIQLRYSIIGILAITSIDDCLNMLCAAGSTNSASEEQRVSCEDRSLLLSFLPTVLCSFVPISLWGIFVIGSIHPSAAGSPLQLFISSIPFNFFSIIVLIAMLLHGSGRLLKSKALKAAEKRVNDGGKIWPPGSERYLREDDNSVWGKAANLLIPILALAVASLTLRSFFSGSIALDSACGLAAALVVMFFLYCGQRLMSPEQYFEYMISGIQSMALPILLYLLTMCFTSMLNHQALSEYFDDAVLILQTAAPFLPGALFLVSTLLTIVLGSSWAMYIIAFPVALRMATGIGLSIPLCVGAVCAAGIAGEKCCVFTGDHLSVGEAIGCDPSAVLSVRIPYAVAFTLISLVLYIIAGFLFV